MKVHAYERGFLIAGGVLLLGCMAALGYASLAAGVHLPGHEGRIHPSDIATTPPFDQPGVRQVGPNEYEVVIVARAWSFTPAEIRVPAGADVTFTATAADVIHGLNVEGTRLNLMLIPGQIARNRHRFDEPGEYLLICHEYCGLGHHAMAGMVIVEAPGGGPAEASPAPGAN
jgi:cytochrome c oxidase subunit 2